MSLLFLVILSCACTGSYGKYYELCYGSDFTLPLKESSLTTFHQELFFLPITPGRRFISVKDEGILVVMKNGTTLNPRYEISPDKFIIREVTERDEGFIAHKLGGYTFTLFRLGLKDCSREVTKTFGSDYYFTCPNNAYSLEFTPLINTHGSQSQVLWNRTNPRASEAGGRGRLQNNKWMMNKITHEYVGYYTFRDENHKFLSRKKMLVEEQHQYFYDEVQGLDLHIRFGMDPALFDMTFKGFNVDAEQVTLMKAGKLDIWSTYNVFQDRIKKLDGPTLHITIDDLQPSDSGRFDFTDQKGRLALVVDLEVKERYPYLKYIGVAVGILMVVCCCCYGKKRCCKKTTRKNHSVPDTEAAPDVYYHDDNTQPPTSPHPNPSPSHGPTYSYPLYPQEPGSTSQTPLVPGPEVPSMSSSEPEAGSTGQEEPPSYDSLFSSGAEPQFELRGTTFPSAPPLNSDTPYSDVYTSDKLNFL